MRTKVGDAEDVRPRESRVRIGQGEAMDGDERLILLVDDSPQMIEMFMRVLEMDSVRVKVAAVGDGAEALDYLFGEGEHSGRDTEERPQLVLLDMSMPHMGGLETLRRIRADERTRRQPVVMYSSSIEPRDVDEAYALGANGYVDKLSGAVPFPQQVEQIVDYWLNINQRSYR
jgi:two-component system, response regulator